MLIVYSQISIKTQTQDYDTITVKKYCWFNFLPSNFKFIELEKVSSTNEGE